MSGSSGGSSNTSFPQATPQMLADAYKNNIPGFLSVTNNQATPTATSIAGAASAANPIYTQSGLNQLNNFAPGYQQAGANLANAQAGTTEGLINGAGGQAASAANALNNSINPLQATNNTQAQNLVNSINLNGLSGGEQSAVERSLNQSNYATGNLGLDNATNAVNNAMNFGGALAGKRAQLGSALGVANGIATQQNNVLNPASFAVNSGNTGTNFGLGTFAPTQGNAAGNAALNFGSSIFGGQSSNASSQISNGRSNNASGGISCFLTTACCEYKGLPDDCEELEILRAFRDKHVPTDEVEEYYRIAPEIVDKIKGRPDKLEVIWDTVRSCVVDIQHGEFDNAHSKYRDMVTNLQKELL